MGGGRGVADMASEGHIYWVQAGAPANPLLLLPLIAQVRWSLGSYAQLLTQPLLGATNLALPGPTGMAINSLTLE